MSSHEAKGRSGWYASLQYGNVANTEILTHFANIISSTQKFEKHFFYQSVLKEND